MSLGERGRWGVSAGVGNNYSSGRGDRRYFSACWLLLIPSEVLRGGREDGYSPQTKASPEEEKDHAEMQLSDGESHYCPPLDCPGSYGQSLWPIRFTTDLHTTLPAQVNALSTSLPTHKRANIFEKKEKFQYLPLLGGSCTALRFMQM